MFILLNKAFARGAKSRRRRILEWAQLYTKSVLFKRKLRKLA
jgi:hypothetical protein